VVVDYKTGAATQGHADDRHRDQVRIYRRALQAALGLDRPPRGELWYLASGEVVKVD
jgi:ATP-dependent exoDNAse (exonuclease V) beta subunit